MQKTKKQWVVVNPLAVGEYKFPQATLDDDACVIATRLNPRHSAQHCVSIVSDAAGSVPETVSVTCSMENGEYASLFLMKAASICPEQTETFLYQLCSDFS